MTARGTETQLTLHTCIMIGMGQNIWFSEVFELQARECEPMLFFIIPYKNYSFYDL